MNDVTHSLHTRMDAWLRPAAGRLARAYSLAFEALFQFANSGWAGWLQRLWFVGLIVAGAILWGYLLNWGNIEFAYHDWAEGITHRIAFLQDAVTSGQLPLHMPDPSALRNVSDRYLVVPDTILSPTVFALAFLPLGTFVLFNTVLLFTVGSLGMWRIAQRYRLPPIPLTAMLLVVSFHGRITDLIVIGDVHWAGYYLLPWFVYLLLQAIEGTSGWRWTLKLSAVLFFMFLQGSFHLFLISLMFMALLMLTNRRLAGTMLIGGAFALLASAVRILPPALNSGGFDVEFLSGFDSALQLVTSMIDLRPMLRQAVFRNSALNPLGWWEMDHYIGLAGLLFVTVFGVGMWFRAPSEQRNYRELAIPTLVLATLSIGRIFKPISALAIPMISSQRVSTRFFILVLVVVAIMAAIHLSRVLRDRRLPPAAQVGLLAGVVVLGHDIWQHAKLWRVERLPELFDFREIDLGLAYVANHADPPYLLAFWSGLAITGIAFIGLIALSLRERNSSGVAPAASPPAKIAE